MRSLLALFTFCFSVSASIAQVDCRPYVPTKEGTKWEITNYNSKGKATGRITYELLEKTESGNTITFTIESTTFDKKDEEVYRNTFNAKCVDGKFQFDMTVKMDGAAMQNYQNMDVELDATEFEIPTLDEPVGTTLKDGSLKVGIKAGGALNLNMTVLVTDRKIEAKEKMKTPAGEFDTVVLSQKASTKFVLKVEATSKEWYAENVGMVRSESYNKKGKLMGYSELTSLEQ